MWCLFREEPLRSRMQLVTSSGLQSPTQSRRSSLGHRLLLCCSSYRTDTGLFLDPSSHRRTKGHRRDLQPLEKMNRKNKNGRINTKTQETLPDSRILQTDSPHSLTGRLSLTSFLWRRREPLLMIRDQLIVSR